MNLSGTVILPELVPINLEWHSGSTWGYRVRVVNDGIGDTANGGIADLSNMIVRGSWGDAGGPLHSACEYQFPLQDPIDFLYPNLAPG